MIEISAVRDLVAIFGLLAGFAYYIVTVQNANKMRKTQLFLDIYNERESQEHQEKALAINVLWTFVDFDDWWNKYGPETNLESSASFVSYENNLAKAGFLVREGMIDVNEVYEMLGGAIIQHWEKYDSINLGIRERYNLPSWMEPLEYIYNEMKKIDAERFPELKS